jgi:UDPglucose 6-dehydrogenase
MKSLSVIGIGRLGICFALTLEEAGYSVTGCDIDESYVKSINNKTLKSSEPDVNEKLKKSKNFIATCDLEKTVRHSNNLFVTVASFSEPDGKYDVSQVNSVVDNLINLGAQSRTKHLIICTNVNPGFSDTVSKRLEDYNWTVSFNPETIAQGTILQNQKYPDCVYIGSDNKENIETLVEVYSNVCGNSPSIHIMDRLSAELTKVSLNCYLTCKISFANMVGDLANKIGANPDKVLKAVGSDSRINNKFFRYGFGWGGPCFPRDTRAYINLSKINKMPYNMCEASNITNKKHLEFQVSQFLKTNKTKYFTDSVTYKKGTIILEESQQLEFARLLAQNGIEVTIEESVPVIAQLTACFGDLFIYKRRDNE